MTSRYFIEEPIVGDDATLTGPEAHHLIHVMRAKPGDVVTLFDGTGREFSARVAASSRRDVSLDIVSSSEIDRELPVIVTLAVALPKGDRQKWLVEKATEVGVARIVPLHTARSVAEASRGTLDKLRRAVVEASKQCGRNKLLEIDAPADWTNFATRPRDDCALWIAHPGGEPVGNALQTLVLPQSDNPEDAAGRGPMDIVIAVGPEGGFTDDEVDVACHHGWQPVDLGPRILRVETAAIALASLAATTFSDR